MELPHIGEHCHESSCNQLDFLPVKCDGCKKNFCNDHWTYQGHNCASPRLKDVQVPVCPMCDKPVPSKPGSNPNEAVSRHLDQDCNSGRKRNPRCSKPKCKTRELIKVDCDQCGLNFCLKHRFPLDHECTGTKRVSEAGRAAISRQTQPSQPQGIAKYFQRQAAPSNRPNPTSNRPNPTQIQGNLSEDEALARALQASLNETTTGASSNLTQEEQDRMLALSLAQGDQNSTTRRQNSNSGGDKSCQIS